MTFEGAAWKLILILVCIGNAAAATVCLDIANWTDLFGDGCDWYGSKDGACEAFGDCCEKNGYTAKTACCACGGGEDVEISGPTPAPKGTYRSVCVDFGITRSFVLNSNWSIIFNIF